MSNEDRSVKLHDIVGALIETGVSQSRAVILATDFMFLAYRLNGECHI